MKMRTLDLILLVINAGSSIGAFFLCLYVLKARSFFTKKGENLATKQDIAEITKEVEGVKTNLQFQSRLHEETKLAAIQAFESLDNLYASVVTPHFFREIDTMAFNEIEVLAKQTGDNYNKAFARLNLYIGDSPMIQQFRECAIIIDKLNNAFTVANFEKARFVDFKKEVGDVDIEDYKSDDRIDLYTTTKRSYDVGASRSANASQEALSTLSKNKPVWKQSREELRKTITTFISAKN